MKRKRYLIYFILIFVLIACKRKSERTSEKMDSLKEKRQIRTKYFAGKPDIPNSVREMTSAGIGSLLLGDSLIKLDALFEDKNLLIRNIFINEDGKMWPAKELKSSAGFIIAEAVNTIDLISVLRTNRKDIKTQNGLYAGVLLDSLENIKDSLKINSAHRTMSYGSTGVWFKIDAKSERKFFRGDDTNYSVLKGARIEELIIICGDC